jgi:16S rRNA (guanine(1405)-N(7))-methyltransferase
MKTGPLEQDIVKELKQTAKYGALCDETLLRMASWAAARHASPKEALKAAKRKLHQVCGAYCDKWDLRRVAEIVQALPDEPGADVVRSACRDVLQHHASTRERTASLDLMLSAVLQAAGPVMSLLDLACGLGPFMLPWMALSPGIEYHAVDIDTRLIGILDAFLMKLGLRGGARCGDLIVSVPDTAVDVALLLKALPCLEQQEKGAGLRILPRIRARRLVVSFPTQSLGGRSKGMAQHYESYLHGLAASLHFSVQPHCFPSETFYVLTRCA